jgi:glyoxylase-like metal-dependent hydrolase (beta-lactamase superfamily II)
MYASGTPLAATAKNLEVVMEELASNVYILHGFPKYAINAYLLGGILVDAGIRFMRRSLMSQLRGRQLDAHVLTHAHPDHQGNSHAICSTFGLPLWCGRHDAPAMERGTLSALLPNSLINRLLAICVGGSGHPVERRLREGDRVGDFTIIETPGHTPGHISLWRAADRTLILGDVLANQHPVTQKVGLIEPLARFTLDPARNRQSVAAVAALGPRLVCFGHGPPLRDLAKLRAFVMRLA